MDKAEKPLKIYISYGIEIGVNDENSNPLYPEPNNESVVLKIKSYLQSRGHDVWIDKERIKPGDDWRKTINDAVEFSDVALICLTRKSTKFHSLSQDENLIVLGAYGSNAFPVKLEALDNSERLKSLLSFQISTDLQNWRRYWTADYIDEAWFEKELNNLASFLENANVQAYGDEMMELNKILKPWDMNNRLQSLDRNLKYCYNESNQSWKSFIHDGFCGRASLFKLFEEKKAQTGNAASEKQERVFWLKKEPWFGKSRFAAELYFKNFDVIKTVYFIEYDKKETRDPLTFVKSVAYQLGRSNPSYRKKLLSFLKENLGKINIYTCDPQKLFQSLVVDLLPDVVNEDNKTQWILVDALDAATNKDKNEIASLISQNLANLPPWISFIITSRDNDEVVNEIFAEFSPIEFSKEENDRDLRNFVQNEINALSLKGSNDQQVSEEALDTLLKKSEGTFMYPEMIFRDLKNTTITLDDIYELPHGVIADIRSQFNCYFGDDPEKFKMDITPALDCLFATNEPTTRGDVKKKLEISDDSELDDLLKQLGTLIIQSGSSDEDAIKPFHPCVIDYYNSLWKKLKVFISYGHEIGVKDESGKEYPEPNNESVVIRIKNFLESRGHEVWLDKDKIEEGDDDWRRKIYEGVMSSNIALICLSHRAMKPNGVCRDEISIAVGVRGGYPFSITLEKMDISEYPAYLLNPQLFKEFEDWKTQCVPENVINEAWLDAKLKTLTSRLEEKDVRLYGFEMGKIKKILKPWNMESKLKSLDTTIKYIYNPEINDYETKRFSKFYGRESLFKLFEDKLIQGGKAIRLQSERVLWLKKGPGFGKSRFAAELLYRYCYPFSAFYFIQYGDKVSHKPQTFIKSVAFQLAQTNSTYRSKLLEYLTENQETIDLESGDPQTLFKSLIVDLLSNGIDGNIGTQWILVDALDEATVNDQNKIASLIKYNLQYLPSWLCFFITSRENDEVVNGKFTEYNPIEFSDDENVNDVREYIRQEFDEMKFVVPKEQGTKDELIDMIYEKSEGTFLYPEMVFSDLNNKTITLENIPALPKGVKMYIESQFDRFYEDKKDLYNNEVCPMLSFILTSYEPIPRGVLKYCLGIESNKELSNRLHHLGTFFVQSGYTDESVINSFHKSVNDYCLNEGDSHCYYVDPKDGQKGFANKGLELYKSGLLQWTTRTDEIPDVTQRYFLTWLPSHLMEVNMKKETAAVLSDFSYLMNRLRFGNVDRVLQDYVLFRDKLKGVSQNCDAFFDVICSNMHLLRRNSDDNPAYKIMLQIATEAADDCPVTRSAESWLNPEDAYSPCDWFWLNKVGRPKTYQPKPYKSGIKNADIETATIANDSALSSEGEDRNLESDVRKAVLNRFTDGVNGVIELSSGEILSWSCHTLRLWSVYGICKAVMEGHTDRINGAFELRTGDILSWSKDKTIHIWSPNGKCKEVIDSDNPKYDSYYRILYPDQIYGSFDLKDNDCVVFLRRNSGSIAQWNSVECNSRFSTPTRIDVWHDRCHELLQLNYGNCLSVSFDQAHQLLNGEIDESELVSSVPEPTKSEVIETENELIEDAESDANQTDAVEPKEDAIENVEPAPKPKRGFLSWLFGWK